MGFFSDSTMQLDVSSDVFKSYAFFASILALKMFAMSLLTAVQRFKKGVRNRQQEKIAARSFPGLPIFGIAINH